MKKQKEKEFEICTVGRILSFYSVWAVSKKEAKKKFLRDEKSMNFISSEEVFAEKIIQINEGDYHESN